MRKTNGITLVALVVTIIILLILALITIRLVVGDNGLLSKTEQAAEATKVAMHKEKLQTTLIPVQTDNIVEGKEITTTVVAEALEKENWLVEVEENSLDNIVTVTTDDGYIYDIILGPGSEIEIAEQGKDDGEPRPEVSLTLNPADGANHAEVQIIVSAKEEKNGISKIILSSTGEEIECNGEKTVEKTFTVNENGTYTVKAVSSKNKTGRKSIEVTNSKPRIRDVANKPEIREGLIPVKWNGSDWEVCSESDKDWYNYKEKKWANARSADGSMWVWIPRYAYQISDVGYHTVTAEQIEIAFLKGTTDQPEEGLLDIKHESGANNWLVHPAFENNVEMGGWDRELTGIWVAKFEAGFAGGGNTVTPKDSSVVNTTGQTNFYGAVTSGVTPLKYPVFMGNTYSYNYIEVGDIFNLCRALTEENNPYGFSSNTLDSHLMKNSEWGATVYLTQSKYGKNSEIESNRVNKNNIPSTIYGVTGGDDYINNVAQSSTGNITGIYDINGGCWDYTASYMVNVGNPELYGKSVVDETDLKYKQIYTSYNAERYGDAIWETSSSSTGNSGWGNSYSAIPATNVPFFLRGGDCVYNSPASSIFAFENPRGGYYINCSFRTALVTL